MAQWFEEFLNVSAGLVRNYYRFELHQLGASHSALYLAGVAPPIARRSPAATAVSAFLPFCPLACARPMILASRPISKLRPSAQGSIAGSSRQSYAAATFTRNVSTSLRSLSVFAETSSAAVSASFADSIFSLAASLMPPTLRDTSLDPAAA